MPQAEGLTINLSGRAVGASDGRLSGADAERLRATARQFPEIREHATRLLEGPPPPPPVDTGFPISDRCGCGWAVVEPVQFHRRGSDHCRAEQ